MRRVEALVLAQGKWETTLLTSKRIQTTDEREAGGCVCGELAKIGALLQPSDPLKVRACPLPKARSEVNREGAVRGVESHDLFEACPGHILQLVYPTLSSKWREVDVVHEKNEFGAPRSVKLWGRGG